MKEHWLAVLFRLSRPLLSACVFGLCTAYTQAEAGFRVSLNGGTLYGPGARGAHTLQQGSLENFVVTAPLTGIIPFENNGAEPPNVNAESIFDGPVDGLLSDGTKINENVNAAFVVSAADYETGKSVRLLIASISEEKVERDAKGNLTFSLNVGFDSGDPKNVIRLPVQLVTGAAVVPASLKTQKGLPGGQDQAGWFPAGRAVIGRLGDFDQDGFLDGTFVLTGNAPPELEIGGGDPVVIVRPFTSEIPVVPLEAAFFTLNGIAKNFEIDEVKASFDAKTTWGSVEYLIDITERLDAALGNVDRAIHDKAALSSSLTIAAFAQLRLSITNALKDTAKAIKTVSSGRRQEGKRAFNSALTSVATAAAILTEIKKKF